MTYSFVFPTPALPALGSFLFFGFSVGEGDLPGPDLGNTWGEGLGTACLYTQPPSHLAVDWTLLPGLCPESRPWLHEHEWGVWEKFLLFPALANP
jgi:hypothetical protein